MGFRGSPCKCGVCLVVKSAVCVACVSMCGIGIDFRLSNLGSRGIEVVVGACAECVCVWPYTGV